MLFLYFFGGLRTPPGHPDLVANQSGLGSSGGWRQLDHGDPGLGVFTLDSHYVSDCLSQRYRGLRLGLAWFGSLV